jgi:nitrite reductase/ring-hydroxylating ferredoxin subunit
MPGIMGANQAKDSTRMIKKTVLIVGLGILVVFSHCNNDWLDDPIPVTVFPDKPILLNNEPNLSMDGGFIYVNDIGVRGVIIYRQNASNYIAYERNCSYRPLDACATVEVDGSNLFMIDPCCSSLFEFSTGIPQAGPAWRPLRRYATSLNGTLLTITSDFLD